MSVLRLAVGERDGRLTICFGGELDLADVPVAGAAIEGALASRDEVTIDLAGLEFIDLAGAALLLAFASRDHGTETTVLASRWPGVNRILRAVGLEPAENG